MKIHACILIQACIFTLFWEKPPPILLFKPVRVLETAEYKDLLDTVTKMIIVKYLM